MNGTRAAFWAVGIAFVLGGVYMLYFEANLDRWIPFGMLMAGFVVFIGLATMGFAGSRSRVEHLAQPAASRTTVIEASPSVVREREVYSNSEVYQDPEPTRRVRTRREVIESDTLPLRSRGRRPARTAFAQVDEDEVEFTDKPRRRPARSSRTTPTKRVTRSSVTTKRSK